MVRAIPCRQSDAYFFDLNAFLTMYDADHYLGWASRTLMISGFLYQDFPWLETLCKHWKRSFGELLLPPETIIHGEFYPQNVLINDGTVCPVDWESSAIAVGEIDLAALTENWPEEIVKQCKLEYQRERWGKSTHVNFQQRFDAARIYLQLRWLGEQKGLTPHEYKNNLWRFEKLRSIGERLGLI